MSQRITPLSRNQLLELEALLRGLIAIASQPPPPPPSPTQQHQHQHHQSSLGDQSWPSTAPSTPTSVLATSARPVTSVYASQNAVGDARNTSVGDFASAHDATAAVGASPCPDHAAVHGTFIDVFADSTTSVTWRLYDKILYLVWWSYRPASCANCGMQDAWMPSGDVEFKCASCIAGAGTTRSNAVVKDTPEGDDGGGYDGNNSGEDDEVEEKDKHGGGGGGGGGLSSGGGGPIETYLFYYEWLQRIPVLGAASSAAVADGAGKMSAAAATGSSQPGNTRAARSSIPIASMQQQQQQATSTAHHNTVSSSLMLPTGEALPTVLRAAYDMSCLLTAPGLPRGTAAVIRAAALYMSLLLHRYVSLFPLFCMAGKIRAENGRSGSSDGAHTAAAAAAAAVDTHLIGVELQWIDIELVSLLLGVAAPSFFESTEVSVQHLQNIFTVAAAYGVPSVLWHPGRVPGRVEVIKALKEKAVPLCPLHSTTAGVSGLCPEHTAMIVALELARRVDAHPVAASSTSPAAAAQNAQRIGMWLDALGLYPSRRVYRDVNSFHRLVDEEEKAATQRESGGGESEEDAERRHSSAVRAWELSLTELAAVKDTHLLSAAERHARRHDTVINASTSSSSTPLTTSRSPFYRRFEWILTSPCANALLHVFAAVFRLTPMELADMALRSGLYQGHASGFVATLKTAVLRGAFDAMPLARRLSPLTSSWMSVYMALHSGDRLPLLAALFQMNDGLNASRDRQVALTRLLQRILRKHHAAQLYQLNYVVRVTDDDEQHFNGIYFLSNVLWQEGLAVFTCLRSGRKTITLNRFSHTLSLCYMNAKEKVVSHLNMHVVSPVVAAIETESTRLVMEVALGAVVSGASTHGNPWGTVVRCLDKCARVRRRMRVPMLASRLDALASIHEQSKSAVRRFQQFPILPGHGVGTGGGGGMGPTLLGWGETETLLAAAPHLDVSQLRRDLQWNFLALPHASLLLGLSENRVVAMYASLVGLLELIQVRLSAQRAAAADAASRTALVNNWVEELLFVEDDEEDDAAAAAEDLMNHFRSPFAEANRTGLGWSPPTYRNSRGGTPQLARSPKSKFVSVSTAANTTGSGAPSSAFSTSYASGNNSGRGGAAPSAFARHAYTATPPSLAPMRSPILRPNPAAATPTTAASARGTTQGSSSSSSAANRITTTSSHNAVSTPVHRFQPPPSPSSVFFGNGTSSTPPLSFTTTTTATAMHSSNSNHGGGGAAPSGNKRTTGKLSGAGAAAAAGGEVDGFGSLPPDLCLSASTADVEKRRASGRRGRRGHDSSESDDENGDEEEHGKHQRSGRAAAAAAKEEQLSQVLRLLRRALPPYWEVLLGLATEVHLPTSVSHGRHPARRGGVQEEDDEDEDPEEEDGRALRRERRRRLGHRATQDHESGATRSATGAAAAAAAAASNRTAAAKESTTAPQRSESAVMHRPFNVFDAEECRRRLHRIYRFIGTYVQMKQRCMALAAAGTLPEAPPPSVPSSPPMPTTTSGKAATGSPHTPLRGVGGAVGGVLRSPQPSQQQQQQLPPPPPYPVVGKAGGGSAFVLSPRRSGSTSPIPLSPEPRSAIATAVAVTANGNATGETATAAAATRHASSNSPRRPPQRSSTTTPLSPPRRSSPPLHAVALAAKRVGGGSGGSAAVVQRGKERGGRDATAVVSLIDDADFSLPPSEVTWADQPHQQQQQRGRAPWPSPPQAEKVEGKEGRSDPRTRRQQQQRPAASSSSTSSESNETDEEEDMGQAAAAAAAAAAVVSLGPSARKRSRNEQKDEGSDSDDAEAEAPQQQRLRRKAKKLGRRRRRQEQSAQYNSETQQQQQQQQHRTSSPSRSASNGEERSSRSPEIRAWRNGKISGSVSPLGNSPALAPRPPNADGALPRQSARIGSPANPSAVSVVPSIRARAAHTPSEGMEEGRDRSSDASASDSGRSADYDTDTC